MAASTHSHDLAVQRYSLPMLWHLLSLDAPTIAALWFMLAARTAHLPLHATDVAALTLGTWMLYVIDRLLDALLAGKHLQEERHVFHGVHRNAFLVLLGCALPVLIVLLRSMTSPLLHAYLWLGLALAGYFTLIHMQAVAHHIPKELAVGIIFAATIFMPEFLAGEMRRLWPMAACFGTLCWLNCTIIYKREHHSVREAHWSTRFAIRCMPLLFAGLTAADLIFFFSTKDFRPFSSSILLSVLLMTALCTVLHRMERLHFRVAADAALLTPLFFLPWLLR